MNLPIPNRRAAGRTLAAFLEHYRDQSDVLVLALSGNAVPVAYEIAHGLEASLDLVLVQALAAPAGSELSLGAVVSGGKPVMNEDILWSYDVRRPLLSEETRRQQQALYQQEQRLRGERPWPDVRGRTVILVEDCLLHGHRIRAAARVLREQDIERLVVAVPVASTRVLDEIQALSDEVAYIATQEPFLGIDWWFEDARPVSTEEVRQLLSQISPEPAMAPAQDRLAKRPTSFLS